MASWSVWSYRGCVVSLILLASVIGDDIVFVPDDGIKAPSTTTPTAVSGIPAEVVTVAQNDTDADSHVSAVQTLLFQATEESSSDSNADQTPDLSLSALGSRSILPRQYSECRAPTRETGTCGTVRQCPGIYRIRDARYLRSFLCGYSGQTPLVCCPRRWTTQYFYGHQASATPAAAAAAATATTPTTTTTTTTRHPMYYNAGYESYPSQEQSQTGYDRYNNPNSPYNRFNPYNSYNSYSQPRPQYSVYSEYPRPVNNFYFSSATTTTTTTTTTTSRPTRAGTPEPARTTTQSSATVRPQKPSFLPEKCGVSSGLSRITGGTEVIPGSFPWMAAIYIQSGSSWLQACGGSLVSNLHVITAAHCVVSGSRSQNLPARLFLIRLGDHNLATVDDLPEGVTKDVKVAKISRHSQFNQNTYKNDIALIELESPVSFSQYIQPVCLPFDAINENLENEIALITGWGYTKFDGEGSDVLRQASIRIWSENECREAFKKEVTITSEYLCAGDASGKKDSCQGDSGGPLVYNEGTRYYLIGVVSFGKKCATPGYPGAYTRVTKYLDWLNAHF